MMNFLKLNRDEPQIAVRPVKTTTPVSIATVPECHLLLCAEEEAMREWLKVAQAIGASPQQIGEVELKLWLKEECIQVYPATTVFKYLGEKAGDKKWNFQGLRKSDTVRNLHAYATWPGNGSGHVLPQPLYSTVPLPVLMTVQKVIGRFGDRANFFVTHMGDPDPFLAVTVDDCAIFFIERWNEPSFRG